jgi:Xaa-Pro aminopeptidase
MKKRATGFDYSGRMRRLRKLLTEEGLDALISVTIEDNNKNVYYLCGFGGTTGALAVSSKGGVLAVDARYIERAQEEAVGVKVAPIPLNVRRSGDFAHYVETALGGIALPKNSKIGIEGMRVPLLMARAWEERLGVTLIPTRGLVERLRQVKDAEEIRHLARAGKITSEVFETVSKKVRAGMRESDIARMLDIELIQRGALGASFKAIIASGKNSAMPHHETGKRKLLAGEPLVMDFGGIFPGGYCSDLTRTIFVPGKKPHPKMLEIYRIVREANTKAFQALMPGISWKQYDGAAREYISEKGFGAHFTHGVGHSIGLEVHDPFDHERGIFAPGFVFSNEPGIYISGLGGVRIEDDVVVTKTGAKLLTPAPYLRV